MKKIITAIGNPIINEKLKKEKTIKIINNDILYAEAIHEILQKTKIDFLIISEKILEGININNEIKEIKKIQKNIKIIFLIKNKNNFYKLLKNKNIYLININKNINNNELIIKLKKIINYKKTNNNKNNINNKKIFENNFIIIDCNTQNNRDLNIFKIPDGKNIILLIEPTILGIKQGRKIINELFKIKKENMYIILKNYNKKSVNKNIIKNCFKGIYIIGKIKKRREKHGIKK